MLDGGRQYDRVGDVVNTAGGRTGLGFPDSELESEVTAALVRVEDRIVEAVDSADPFVAEAARHLLDAGGKRFRPLLVILTGYFGKPDPDRIADAGAVMELTHLATLYHDDVMDEAKLRRSAPSANARWGNSLAILVGDYLFARAAELAANLGTEAVKLQAQTFARLVHGQIAETIGPREADPIDHHLRVLAEKTGSLIATSARLGGMVSGVEEPMLGALSEYGETIGIAFQLSDDLLDIASESAQSGKTPGTDLREGVPTLPVLYALADEDASPDAQRLREILALGPLTDDALHAEALGLLRDSAALKRARQTVHGYADRARDALTALPDLPARTALAGLCDVVADRSS
ncbi:MAG: polyprenyl synthetase family protein [Hamadaea sp.]|nr:polyprenyl synthetase family protein [Hamadaea sp.]NUR48409.1 polyprenyl synthetase family protein [Hamadaea sp.]NUT04458.1 polyprenyl synthetase family protein [Hamadaea sp.]